MIAQTIATLKNYELWGYLGWVDVAQRYKRSAIGPFWLTINNSVIVLLLSFVWSTLFKVPLAQFLPYFAISNVCWIFISSVIVESTSVITSSESLVKQIKIPIQTLVMRMLWRNFIIFMHLIPIPMVVLFIFPEAAKGNFWALPETIIGIIVAVGFLYFLAMLIGILCTRFRDVTQLVASALQMIFLATPILWQKDLLKGREILYQINPFYHLIEIVRAPVFSGEFPIVSLAIIILVTSFMALIASMVTSRFSKSIVYWI